MKRYLAIAMAAAVLFCMGNVGFAQNNVQIIRQDGTVEVVRIQPFNTQPEVIRIKPYGLNLQPANVPVRTSPAPAPRNYSDTYGVSGPVVIANPYYVEPVRPEPINVEALNQELQQLASVRNKLLQVFKRIFRIP